MSRPRGANALLILLLLLLAAALGLLATLQYRWIDRVSKAERQQMKANMEFAARVFADDLRKELEPIVASFESGEDIAAAHRDLVVAAYNVNRDDEGWYLDNGRNFVPWPAELQTVHERMTAAFRDPNANPPPHMPGPFLADVPALLLVERRGPPSFEGPDFRGGILPRIVLVQLNPVTIRNAVLPRLAQHFSREHDLAVMSGPNVLYRSDPTWPDGHTPADLELALQPIMRGGPERVPFRRMTRLRPAEDAPSPRNQWRLLVRRHDGGVDAVVAAARRRNVGVSFGIVLILGIAVILLAALLRRAERLRQQQIEFVAAISHELNTPVAALRSAGENLRDGIINDREKVVRYGESIVRESTRLGELVGQVLEMAGMQARRIRKHELVDVAAIIEDAVAQCDWLVRGTPIHIETNVDANLPNVSGERGALTRAVQNLVANAVRHGGSGKWIGVRATRVDDQVRITVEDRGPGVDAGESGRLFEPFYRGHNSAATPGAGLGLAIVRQIAIAHGGSVELERRRGGAAFTIVLPAATSHV
jgi:signal transduction histidine kinase